MFPPACQVAGAFSFRWNEGNPPPPPGRRAALFRHAESAPGQFEIVTGHLPALEATDGLLLTREAIAHTARAHAQGRVGGGGGEAGPCHRLSPQTSIGRQPTPPPSRSDRSGVLRLWRLPKGNIRYSSLPGAHQASNKPRMSSVSLHRGAGEIAPIGPDFPKQSDHLFALRIVSPFPMGRIVPPIGDPTDSTEQMIAQAAWRVVFLFLQGGMTSFGPLPGGGQKWGKVTDAEGAGFFLVFL